jgi:hypothetical protein
MIHSETSGNVRFDEAAERTSLGPLSSIIWTDQVVVRSGLLCGCVADVQALKPSACAAQIVRPKRAP